MPEHQQRKENAVKKILNAEFYFVSWEIFDKRDCFQCRQVLEKENLLVPFDPKKKVVYVAYRWDCGSVDPQNDHDTWEYLREMAQPLKDEFDGFFLDRCTMYYIRNSSQQEDNYRLQVDALGLFMRRCYVFVASSYSLYRSRFWILWEIFYAARNRRLIVNENVLPLLEETGTNPKLETVLNWLNADDVTGADPMDQQNLLSQIEELYLEGAGYALIPVTEILTKARWEDIRSTPLAKGQINPSCVLMISHRWIEKGHPDPEDQKIGVIRQFLAERPSQFEYIFFDWCCIDQQKSITKSLAEVDELYAHSHCLCLCDEDYFKRSWCLFEISVNKFNSNAQTLIGAPNGHPILNWLNAAQVVQQMGYLHSLKTVEKGDISLEVPLELPFDQLHLKAQLRQLFRASEITNKADMRIILNLLDKLIQAPE